MVSNRRVEVQIICFVLILFCVAVMPLEATNHSFAQAEELSTGQEALGWLVPEEPPFPDTIQNSTLAIGNVGGVTPTCSISDRQTTGGAAAADIGEGSFQVNPASIVLGVPLESKPIEAKNTGLAASGWQNIMTDGFEGAFPGSWFVAPSSGYADAYWGKDTYNPHSGSYSAFCAKGGSAGVNPPGNYPNNMAAWMIYGPFSLADATDAELNFYCWLSTESNYDYLMWVASVDPRDFDNGWSWSGNSGGWVSETFDLTDVPGLGNLCGQSQVWVAFLFLSDEGVGYEGAFIDDVVLRKYVPASNNPPYTPSTPSPANHAAGISINADLSWTGGDPDAGDTVTYDVYFGTGPSPSLVSDNQAGTTYDPGTLAYNTKYYWYIAAADNHGAANGGPIWDFTTGSPNNPPNMPSNPSPLNHVTGISINADVGWTGGDPDAGDTVTYDVYFGTSSSPSLVSDNQGGTSYDPGTLAYDTKYYWRIITTDNHGASTAGPLWDFTIQAQPNNPPNIPSTPSPANHATGVSINTDLSWTGGDPDVGDTVTYDVYFGTSATPPLVSNDQVATTYDPGTLIHGITYYWKIIAMDNHGVTAEGSVWDFTAQPEPTEVGIAPPSQGVTYGDSFTINVTVYPKVGIAGMQFSLSFDPSLLTANGVAEGNLLKQGGASTFFQTGTINNGAGTITGVAGAIITPGQTVSSPGTFATISFTAKTAVGTSALNLSNVIVANKEAQPVAISVSAGSVTVIAYPDWDVNLDGQVNVQDMVLVGQHWGENGAAHWIREDVMRDGVINVQDMVMIGQHWTG
jgi:hypothetical protein